MSLNIRETKKNPRSRFVREETSQKWERKLKSDFLMQTRIASKPVNFGDQIEDIF